MALRQFYRSENRFMEKVFLKQYGERRTGTNYLRALLFANYPNAIPMMHVLGDKHAPPVDFAAHWERVRSMPEPAWNFVTSTTWAAPSETTDANNPGQLKHMREVAGMMTDSFDPAQLGFLILAKHPYSWAASLARYSRWLDEPDGTMGLRHANSLKIACELYNERHRAWLELHRQSKGRSLIVRFEKLLEEPRYMLGLLERTFGLQRADLEPKFIQQRTGPTHWDDHPITFEEGRFNPNTYRDRNYQAQLSEEMWGWVREKIDWDLAAEFGYHKLHFRG